MPDETPPALTGQSQAIHVDDNHTVVDPVGPPSDVAVMVARSFPITTHADSPSQWFDETIHGPYETVPVYWGRSQAIHVYGEAAVAPTQPTPIPSCRCCAQCSPTVYHILDTYNRTHSPGGWGNTESPVVPYTDSGAYAGLEVEPQFGTIHFTSAFDVVIEQELIFPASPAHNLNGHWIFDAGAFDSARHTVIQFICGVSLFFGRNATGSSHANDIWTFASTSDVLEGTQSVTSNFGGGIFGGPFHVRIVCAGPGSDASFFFWKDSDPEPTTPMGTVHTPADAPFDRWKVIISRASSTQDWDLYMEGLLEIGFEIPCTDLIASGGGGTPGRAPASLPPGGAVVTSFTSFSQSDFEALVAAMTCDVIELAAGTYHNWHLRHGLDVDRSSRPLWVRPAPGAAVVWDNAGEGGDATGLAYFGFDHYTSDITFYAAGTGGSFTIQNYDIGDTGIVATAYANNIVFNDVTVRNCNGRITTSSHCVYVSTDHVHRGSNLYFDNWDVDVTNHVINAMQTFGSPNADGIHFRNWAVRGTNRVAYYWGDGTGLDVAGITVENVNIVFDVQQTVTGHIENYKVISSLGGPVGAGLGQWGNTGVTDGGPGSGAGSASAGLGSASPGSGSSGGSGGQICAFNLLTEAGVGGPWQVLVDEGTWSVSGHRLSATRLTAGPDVQAHLVGFFDVPRAVVEAGVVLEVKFGYSGGPDINPSIEAFFKVQGANSTRANGRVTGGDSPPNSWSWEANPSITGDSGVLQIGSLTEGVAYTHRLKISPGGGSVELPEKGKLQSLAPPTLPGGDVLTLQIDLNLVVAPAGIGPYPDITIWLDQPALLDLAGNGIGLPGLQECGTVSGDCGSSGTLPVFDDFQNRTTSPNSWGSASSGPAYTSSGTGIHYVNGAGVLQNHSTGISFGEEIELFDAGLPPGGDFAATFWLAASSDREVIAIFFILDNHSFLFGYEHDTYGGSAQLFVTAAYALGGDFGRVTVPFDDTFWASVENYAIFKAERVGAVARIKLWNSDLPEPDWQLTGTSAYSPTPEQDSIHVEMPEADVVTPGPGVVGGQQVAFVHIDFNSFDGGGPCADCQDPNNPGAPLPPFTPGFMPHFRRQIGDPTTTLDSFICTLESGAMVLDWQTRGAVSVWGGELIPWCGKSEADIRGASGSAGTSLGNVRQAWLHYGQNLLIHSGGTFASMMQALAEGRAVILQGDYGVLNLAERCQDNFEGNHAMSVYPYQVGDRLLRGDPLCSGFNEIRISTLQAYAEAFGRAVFGVSSPQKILFAVSRPWTP